MKVIPVTALTMAMLCSLAARAEPFDLGSWKGSLDSQLTLGLGLRLSNPSCSLVGDTTSSCGGSANYQAWSAGDNGDLNYKKGGVFTSYAKLTSELSAHNSEMGIDVLARATGFYDAAAADTHRTQMSSDAQGQMVRNFQLLDLWVGHSFDLGGKQWRVRAGNQVINWGESVFLPGGINASSAIDYQKSLIPGTQIKEYVLPAPLVSVAGQLGNGWNAEGYYQFTWNKNKFPAVGSYWSTADILGRGTPDVVTFDGTNFNATGVDAATIARLQGVGGRISSSTLASINQGLIDGAYVSAPGIPSVYGARVLGEVRPQHGGQFGFAMHNKAEGSVVDYGFYYLRYHDKSPVFNLVGDKASSAGVDYQAVYRENRDLFGVSTNLPVGPWAIGAELSYRPRDAVTLSGCFTPGGPIDANVNLNPVASGNCPLWKDMRKVEAHVTAALTLTPSDNPIVMNVLKADSATLTAEAVFTEYPGLSSQMTQTVEGVTVTQIPQAGGITWLTGDGKPRAVGTASSAGGIVDFNWTYDGTILSGWQFTAGATYFRALMGNTPTLSANYLKGAQSINYYLLLNQNPAVWQAGVNVAYYFGGALPSSQVYKDRDFIGAFVTRNF